MDNLEVSREEKRGQEADNEYEAAAKSVRDSGKHPGIQIFPKSKAYNVNYDLIDWNN